MEGKCPYLLLNQDDTELLKTTAQLIFLIEESPINENGMKVKISHDKYVS